MSTESSFRKNIRIERDPCFFEKAEIEDQIKREQKEREIIDQVSGLQELLDKGRPIVGTLINGYVHCEGVEVSLIESTGIHKPWCLWNYYVSCPKCRHQANLAKMIPNYECQCKRSR